MGARIEAVSTLTSHGLRKPVARRLANEAARACLLQAGKEPGDIDMLINAGVYREDSMGEPALAALIQKDIGANPGHPLTGEHGTFSFDLMNGTCGVNAALQIEAGLLRSGVIRLGAIVASDVGPGPGQPWSACNRLVGGALLLGWDDSATGFTRFSTETFPEYEDLFTSGLVWQERRRRLSGLRGGTGRSQMIIDEKPGYQARLVDCAEEAARRFLRHLGMGAGDIGLLVAAPSFPGFLDPLTGRLGVPGDRVAYVTEDLGNAYSAAPIAALQAGIRSGRLAEAGNTLLLAAGPGITVSLALYRQAQD